LGVTFVLALASAMASGTAGVFAAVCARRVGVLYTAATAVTIDFLVLIVLRLVDPTTSSLGPVFLVQLAIIGLGSTVATVAYWEALRLGPVAVVSALGGTVGLATVALAFLALGERPTVWQAVGIPIAGLGAVLAATSSGSFRRSALRWDGPALAVVAVLSYALVVAMIHGAVIRDGWLTTLLVSRGVAVALLWLLVGAVALRTGSHQPRTPGGANKNSVTAAGVAAAARGLRTFVRPTDVSTVSLLVVLGALDISGLITLALALERGPVWLLGLLVSMAPIPGVVAGLTVFHEKLMPFQWIGVGLVVAGVTVGAAA
jgi:drug/metabolite transporter (DMT)-like permease